jgi:hypothetical protein
MDQFAIYFEKVRNGVAEERMGVTAYGRRATPRTE